MFFAGPDGGEGVERCSSLPAAVSRVEELANSGIVDAAVFALLPVPLQVRQVWRVEVNVPGAMPVGPSSDEAPAEQPVDAEPAAVGTGAALATCCRPSAVGDWGSSPPPEDGGP